MAPVDGRDRTADESVHRDVRRREFLLRARGRAGFVVDLYDIDDEEARQVAEELMSNMLQKSPKKTT